MRIGGYILALVTLAFLGMLYWSSTLIESDLKAMRRQLNELKAETANLSQKLRHAQHIPGSQVTASRARPHIDSKYPNLLEEDPYYTQTLPATLGEDFRPKGVLKQAMIGRPENLHPFNGFRDVSHMLEMCTVQVADLQFGKYETMAPDMAIKLEARPRPDLPDVQEYWVHLRDDVMWQPLNSEHFPESLNLAPHFFEHHPVTAHDFKFFYDAVMNPYISEAKAASLRTYFNDIEEFRVIDDYTFVVRWKPHQKKVKYTSISLTGSLTPLPSFVYQYFADGQKIIDEDDDPDTYRKNSVWAQNFTHHWAKNTIVSCGPFVFDGMNDEGIHFKRNPSHYDPYRVLIEGIQYRFRESFDAVWQDFKTGKIDLCTLSSNQLMELDTFLNSDEYRSQKKNHMGIEKLDYVDLSYSYLGWNLTKPFFSSPKVRQALTMAIDRDRIIEQNLNQMAVSTTGPFFRYSSAYDPSIPSWPYNPDQARRLLDEEGWIDMDGDGIRDKVIGGEKVSFRFKLHYFVKSLSAKVVAEYISTTLRELGVDCQLCGLDVADLSRQVEDKSFDAIYMGWKLGTPPDDPRQLWHSSGAKEKGSSNMIGFMNPEVDQIIEQLNYEYDKATRTTLYHQFHRIIHEEAPYTFLYTPKVRLLYREHVKNLFIPRERPDLIPGADIPNPHLDVIWLEKS